jgi:hypothetical protein
MKSLLSQVLLVALAATATSFGQTEAKTKPVGYESITLNANQFNVVGLRLQGATVASGTLETIGTSSVTDNEGSFASILNAAKTYILEITSGTLSGLTVEATWTSGNVLNTPDNLQQAGIATGTSYNLRPALTLEEIFGTTNSVLTRGFNSASADIIWIPNGVGGYSRYFLHSTNVWRDAASNTNTPNVAVVYTDGLLIEKKGSPATLTLSGEVKINGSTVPVVTGFNVISTIYPAGVELQNFGLEDDLQAGFNSASADIVWVPNGSGGYDRYFRHSTGVWRNAETNVNLPGPVSLGSAILLERKGGATSLDVTPPSTYSNL